MLRDGCKCFGWVVEQEIGFRGATLNLGTLTQRALTLQMTTATRLRGHPGSLAASRHRTGPGVTVWARSSTQRYIKNPDVKFKMFAERPLQ